MSSRDRYEQIPMAERHEPKFWESFNVYPKWLLISIAVIGVLLWGGGIMLHATGNAPEQQIQVQDR